MLRPTHRHSLVSALAVLAGTSFAEHEYSNFTRSCPDVTLRAGFGGLVDQLHASCYEAAPVEGAAFPLLHNSTLNLNLCLGIDYTTARLVWSIYGKFSNYCKNCHVVGRTKLGCSCSTLSGTVANSTIDLDTGISNDNGTLSCQGGIGQ